jgi:hypothetical protein
MSQSSKGVSILTFGSSRVNSDLVEQCRVVV